MPPSPADAAGAAAAAGAPVEDVVVASGCAAVNVSTGAGWSGSLPPGVGRSIQRTTSPLE